jgi:fructose 1,6-bisphosphatase
MDITLFSEEYVDVLGNVARDATRAKVQAEADEWRRQGFVGPTMAPPAELAYTGIVDALARLELEFTRRPSSELVTSAGG